MAALTGLISLENGPDYMGTKAIRQLLRLRSLHLRSHPHFTNAQLSNLSTLCFLTSLQL
jgi:hypothetical protein